MLAIILHIILKVVISIGLLMSVAAISNNARVALYNLVYQVRNMELAHDDKNRRIIRAEIKSRFSSKWAKVHGTFYLYDCFSWHFDEDKQVYVSRYSFFMADCLSSLAEKHFSPMLKTEVFDPCFTDEEYEK